MNRNYTITIEEKHPTEDYWLYSLTCPTVPSHGGDPVPQSLTPNGPVRLEKIFDILMIQEFGFA